MTVHLDILARIAVIKTNYPVFFRSTLDAHGLISSASRASSPELSDDELHIPVDGGFNPEDSQHASLFRYSARTV